MHIRIVAHAPHILYLNIYYEESLNLVTICVQNSIVTVF